MNYKKLLNYDDAFVTREKINSNFETMYKYANGQLQKGKCADLALDGWTLNNTDNCYHYDIAYDFNLNGSYVTFFVYMYAEDGVNYEVVNCDMVRDTINGKLTILSDIRFKGWVACV